MDNIVSHLNNDNSMSNDNDQSSKLHDSSLTTTTTSQSPSRAPSPEPKQPRPHDKLLKELRRAMPHWNGSLISVENNINNENNLNNPNTNDTHNGISNNTVQQNEIQLQEHAQNMNNEASTSNQAEASNNTTTTTATPVQDDNISMHDRNDTISSTTQSTITNTTTKSCTMTSTVQNDLKYAPITHHINEPDIIVVYPPLTLGNGQRDNAATSTNTKKSNTRQPTTTTAPISEYTTPLTIRQTIQSQLRESVHSLNQSIESHNDQLDNIISNADEENLTKKLFSQFQQQNLRPLDPILSNNITNDEDNDTNIKNTAYAQFVPHEPSFLTSMMQTVNSNLNTNRNSAQTNVQLLSLSTSTITLHDTILNLDSTLSKHVNYSHVLKPIIDSDLEDELNMPQGGSLNASRNKKGAGDKNVRNRRVLVKNIDVEKQHEINEQDQDVNEQDELDDVGAPSQSATRVYQMIDAHANPVDPIRKVGNKNIMVDHNRDGVGGNTNTTITSSDTLTTTSATPQVRKHSHTPFEPVYEPYYAEQEIDDDSESEEYIDPSFLRQKYRYKNTNIINTVVENQFDENGQPIPPQLDENGQVIITTSTRSQRVRRFTRYYVDPPLEDEIKTLKKSRPPKQSKPQKKVKEKQAKGPISPSNATTPSGKKAKAKVSLVHDLNNDSIDGEPISLENMNILTNTPLPPLVITPELISTTDWTFIQEALLLTPMYINEIANLPQNDNLNILFGPNVKLAKRAFNLYRHFSTEYFTALNSLCADESQTRTNKPTYCMLCLFYSVASNIIDIHIPRHTPSDPTTVHDYQNQLTAQSASAQNDPVLAQMPKSTKTARSPLNFDISTTPLDTNAVPTAHNWCGTCSFMLSSKKAATLHYRSPHHLIQYNLDLLSNPVDDLRQFVFNQQPLIPSYTDKEKYLPVITTTLIPASSAGTQVDAQSLDTLTNTTITPITPITPHTDPIITITPTPITDVTTTTTTTTTTTAATTTTTTDSTTMNDDNDQDANNSVKTTAETTAETTAQITTTTTTTPASGDNSVPMVSALALQRHFQLPDNIKAHAYIPSDTDTDAYLDSLSVDLSQFALGKLMLEYGRHEMLANLQSLSDHAHRKHCRELHQRYKASLPVDDTIFGRANSSLNANSFQINASSTSFTSLSNDPTSQAHSGTLVSMPLTGSRSANASNRTSSTPAILRFSKKRDPTATTASTTTDSTTTIANTTTTAPALNYNGPYYPDFATILQILLLTPFFINEIANFSREPNLYIHFRHVKTYTVKFPQYYNVAISGYFNNQTNPTKYNSQLTYCVACLVYGTTIQMGNHAKFHVTSDYSAGNNNSSSTNTTVGPGGASLGGYGGAGGMYGSSGKDGSGLIAALAPTTTTAKDTSDSWCSSCCHILQSRQAIALHSNALSPHLTQYNLGLLTNHVDEIKQSFFTKNNKKIHFFPAPLQREIYFPLLSNYSEIYLQRHFSLPTEMYDLAFVPDDGYGNQYANIDNVNTINNPNAHRIMLRDLPLGKLLIQFGQGEAVDELQTISNQLHKLHCNEVLLNNGIVPSSALDLTSEFKRSLLLLPMLINMMVNLPSIYGNNHCLVNQGTTNDNENAFYGIELTHMNLENLFFNVPLSYCNSGVTLVDDALNIKVCILCLGQFSTYNQCMQHITHHINAQRLIAQKNSANGGGVAGDMSNNDSVTTTITTPTTPTSPTQSLLQQPILQQASSSMSTSNTTTQQQHAATETLCPSCVIQCEPSKYYLHTVLRSNITHLIHFNLSLLTNPIHHVLKFFFYDSELLIPQPIDDYQPIIVATSNNNNNNNNISNTTTINSNNDNLGTTTVDAATVDTTQNTNDNVSDVNSLDFFITQHLSLPQHIIGMGYTPQNPETGELNDPNTHTIDLMQFPLIQSLQSLYGYDFVDSIQNESNILHREHCKEIYNNFLMVNAAALGFDPITMHQADGHSGVQIEEIEHNDGQIEQDNTQPDTEPQQSQGSNINTNHDDGLNPTTTTTTNTTNIVKTNTDLNQQNCQTEQDTMQDDNHDVQGGDQLVGMEMNSNHKRVPQQQLDSDYVKKARPNTMNDDDYVNANDCSINQPTSDQNNPATREATNDN